MVKEVVADLLEVGRLVVAGLPLPRLVGSVAGLPLPHLVGSVPLAVEVPLLVVANPEGVHPRVVVGHLPDLVQTLCHHGPVVG